ncbi:MAG: glycosyltransferase [Ruminococcus sp.]|nr:glycosyltransferase [Ruminococcus sp.]
MSQLKISFVIPCYNSENTILPVINEIIATVTEKGNYEYEIITAVDGSPDNVGEVLFNRAENNPHIKVIILSKNYGQASAQMAAIRYASGDYVVFLDDDGQCPIDKVFELIAPLEGKYDIAVAKYKKRHKVHSKISEAL